MSWEQPWSWRREWREPSGVLELYDAAGNPRAEVVLRAADTPVDGGLLAKAERWASGQLERLWRARRGGLPDGQSATVLLPDGSLGEVVNGRSSGWRRVHRNGSLQLAGRHYAIRHTSRRRTRVLRDGAPLVTLRRTGLRPRWRSDATGELRLRLRRDTAAIDPIDELAVVVTTTACGPAGRRGWFSQLGSELSPW